jgi:hypothetical protein
MNAGTTLALEDVEVGETHSRQAQSDRYLRFGRGLDVETGARVTVLRGLFDRNRETSVVAMGEETVLDLEHVMVRDSLPAECADLPAEDPDSCADFGGGTGIGAYGGAEVTIASVATQTAALAGLQIATGSSVAGQGLEIRGNPIGVNVQDAKEGYDFFEAVTGVLMEDNAVNYDTQSLYVPEPFDL